MRDIMKAASIGPCMEFQYNNGKHPFLYMHDESNLVVFRLISSPSIHSAQFCVDSGSVAYILGRRRADDDNSVWLSLNCHL